MIPVTDPQLLSQLNAPEQSAMPTPAAPAVPSGPVTSVVPHTQGLTRVTDPQVLAQLNTPTAPAAQTPGSGGFWSNVGNDIEGGAKWAGNSLVSLEDGIAGVIPGDRELNNWMVSKLPGAPSTQQLSAIEANADANHKIAHTVGTGVGTVASYELGGELAEPVAGLIKGEGLLPSVARSVITNAAGGAASDLRHPFIGATTSGLLGGLGTGVGLALRDSDLIANLKNSGLTPTMGTGNKLVRALVNKSAEAKTSLTKFGQNDLWRSAVSSFKGIPGVSDNTLSELTDSPSIQGVKDLQSQLYQGAHDSLKGTVIPSTSAPTLVSASGAPIASTSSTLGGALKTTVGDYAANVAKTDQSPLVKQYADDIGDLSSRGKLTGNNALELYRNIRNQAFSAENHQTKEALLSLGGALHDALTSVASDGGQALNAADTSYGKTKVLESALQRSNGAKPSIQNMLSADRAAGKFVGREGPYSSAVNAANEAYKGSPETPGRFGNLLAGAVTEGLPLLVGAASEAHGGSGILPYLGATVAEKAVGPLIGRYATKPISDGVPTLAQALMRAARNSAAARVVAKATNQSN